jgi:hypothetical protein
MSEAAAQGGTPHHPIGLVATDGLRRSRLTTFVRVILAIPHLLVVALWAFAVWFVVTGAWFAALGTRNLDAWLLRHVVQTYGYTLLLTSRYPSLAGAPTA